jgi:hypothetical protein
VHGAGSNQFRIKLGILGINDAGNGNSDLQAQMQATSVTATGTQLGTKGVPVSLSIYCKSANKKL